MAYINITNIQLLNNPAPFTSSLTFQVTFECLKELPDEVEWKLVYVGSSKDPTYDQVLDSFTMGPLEYGAMQFDLESNPPDQNKIPQSEILGVTAIILSVSYNNQEFFRVGYYVYNYYLDQELADNPPETVQIDKVYRNILSDKPRITHFDIKWGDEKEEPVESADGQQESQAHEGDDSMLKKKLFMDEDELSHSLASISLQQNPFAAAANEQESHSLSQYFLAPNSTPGVFVDAISGNREELSKGNPFI